MNLSKPFNYSSKEVYKARNRVITGLSTLLIFCPSTLSPIRHELLLMREKVRVFGLDLIDYWDDAD